MCITRSFEFLMLYQIYCFIGDDLVVETHDMLRLEPGGGDLELLCVDEVDHVRFEQHLVSVLKFRDVGFTGAPHP